MPLYKHYRVFISSPGDVEQERAVAERIINDASRTLRETIHVCLDVIMWEKFPPDISEVSIQKRINEKVATCDFFLLILNKRYGSLEQGEPLSNTEREVNAMIESKRKFIFLTYCKAVKEDKKILKDTQYLQLLELKKRLGKNHNALMKSFKNSHDFEEEFTHHLYQVILAEQNHNFKVEKLKMFWSLGSVENTNRPETIIVYPPIPRKWMASDDDEHFWHRRLQPNVFFEDFKAISKIAKMMNLVRAKFKVYSNFTFNMLEADNRAKNIIWVCLPRQRPAINELKEKYPDRRFDIIPRGQRSEAKIRWKNKDGVFFDIHSPLRQYLFTQRLHIDRDTEWSSTLRNVLAKDYAIVARMKKAIPQEEEWTGTKVKEFYIAGIHGLGTWGAACYLDRNYNTFNFDADEDIQLLLEVTYENGVVKNVIDVSDKDESYFQKENDLETVMENVQRFQSGVLDDQSEED